MPIAARVISTLLAIATSACSGSGRPGPEFAPVAATRSVDSAQPLARIDLTRVQPKLAALTVRRVTADDPVYRRKKTYEGVALDEVLAQFTDRMTVRDETPVVFVASDGYRSPATVGLVRRHRGLLALRDVEAEAGESWLPLPGTLSDTPAPYYVVWPVDPAAAGTTLPWPYGVVAIEMWAQDPLAAARPDPGDAAAVRGFGVFESRCVSCHSVNGAGGTVGPELNVPANVTEYWNDAALRRFIADPRQIRAFSRMPTIGTTGKDADDIVRYLAGMRYRKVSPSP